MIVNRFSQLTQVFDDLGPGDLFIGQVPSSYLRSAIFIDLVARGVRLLPSAGAQTLSASKSAQAFVLKKWMASDTRVIYRRKALLDAVAAYERSGITSAVTKAEHQHCGHGVRKWDQLETLYNCLSLDDRHYPFVLQPFLDVETDLRVIVVGDFWEAYARCNPHGFRMNLAAGGQSRPYTLSDSQKALCLEIMTRAQMPFAHIDLLITRDGATYLSEVSLNGGLHGATISGAELAQLKQAHLSWLAEIPS
jgi:glutathione synthase/RimK-type ligase-like ATP-grasp enzyme